MTGKKFPKKGDLYWVALDPSISSETKKTRPCLVISNDHGNELSDVIIIAPITSKIKKVYPFELETVVMNKPAKVMFNQVKTIDKSRLGHFIGKIELKMQLVDQAIKLVFGIK